MKQIIMDDFLKAFFKGLEVFANFDRKDKINEARSLIEGHRYDEALSILEKLKHSPDEKSAASLTIYLLKAICYGALDYKQSARNCINVILSMDRMSLSPVYQYILSNAKKLARDIEKEI